MLLRDQMKDYPFSTGERAAVDYILHKQEQIAEYSTKMIADETYTSPSVLIRIAKKLGYKGWNDLKKSYLDECAYLNSHLTDIDPNFPFTNQDTITNIASKITQLHVESAEDTLSLLQHDSFQKAVRIMQRAKRINLYAIGDLNYLAENFVFKLRRIRKDAFIDPNQDNMYHNAAMTQSTECAICISYSGETPALLHTVNILKENQVPIIVITSIGYNQLSQLADAVLYISTRERSYSKIGNFTSEESISLLLDILYSCLFSLNYQQNIDYKLNISKRIETNRRIENPIVVEKGKED